MLNRFKNWLLAVTVLLFAQPVWTASLSDINISSGNSQARVTFLFIGDPEYAFSQIDKRRVALDIKQTGVIHGLPLHFSGRNLVKSIRSGTPKDTQSLRLIIDLTQNGKTYAVKQQQGANYYTVVFTINAEVPLPLPTNEVVAKRIEETLAIARRHRQLESKQNLVKAQHDRLTILTSSDTAAIHQAARARVVNTDDKVIIAIDAGHGGQDPGAIGQGGTLEKNVTIAIARKLHMLLNKNPMFKAVMTRDGDYFISVMGRSDVARKQNANFLVSIHADAALNRSVTGASVWVLSNRRANSEMTNWLEEHEKQSELLGGAGDVLANSQADPYLNQAVLDLQFDHSRRVGYNVAKKILAQLADIGSLHKSLPEHASMGVLRSPDIPSILVETGFISNLGEERLLASDCYQQQIASAIYNGLRIWFEVHPLQSSPPHSAGQYNRYYLRRIYAN